MIPPEKYAQDWECAARKQGAAGGNEPADCNWPFCGCDLYASRVIEVIQESGYTITKHEGRPTITITGEELANLVQAYRE